MRARRHTLVIGIAGLTAAIGLALLTPRVEPDLPAAAAFLAALVVVTVLDLWLPGKGVAGMSTSIALGAMLRFDALIVIAMLTVAESIAMIPKTGGRAIDRSILTLSTRSIAASLCSMVLAALSLHPARARLIGPTPVRPSAYVYLLAVGLLFGLLEGGLAQLGASYERGLFARVDLPEGVEFVGWLLAAQASVGVLSAVMYKTMGAWGLVIAVVIVLVMRQSFLLLLQIRQAYESTIDVLVRAMEAQNPRRVGRSKRVSGLCRDVGRRMGLRGRELERLAYSALLYDVSAIDEESEDEGRRSAVRIIDGVEFLRDVVPVLRACDGDCDGLPEMDLLMAYIVLTASPASAGLAAHRHVRERLNPETVDEVNRWSERLAGLVHHPFHLDEETEEAAS